MKTLLIGAGALAVLNAAPPVAAQQLRVAYYGETITHYGLKAAYEHSLAARVKSGNGARKELLVAPGLAVYRHPHNHLGVIVSPELLYRRTGARGGLLEAGVAPSYFRYFLAGTTYQVNGQGELEKVPLAGRSAFLPTVFVGVGRDLRVSRQASWGWYSRLLLSKQYPYNAGSLTRFALEAGIIKSLKTQ
ncbi:hypothetical protein [Hymenobacter sp. B81]|uniref:hypothetical protein n=1 Tax=Hymenobacter sp. B81 TaxID=3344878 RepID=UPI0037DC562D